MIATTVEQSKRLFEAGVSLETADLVWCKAVNGRWYLAIKGEVPFWEYEAWSLGALWNLCKDQSIELCTADCSAEEALIILVTRLVCINENG